jgi:peroxiredoxin
MMTDSTRWQASDHTPERNTMAATVGEMAPDFSLPGTTGPGLDLSELRGKQRASLFFYPADRTAG